MSTKLKRRKDFESMADYLKYIFAEERKIYGYSPLAGEKDVNKQGSGESPQKGKGE